MNNLIKILSVNDLESLLSLEDIELSKKHIVIMCDFDNISDKINVFCKEHPVYSVIAIRPNKYYSQVAIQFDNIPFFVSDDETEAIKIVSKLVSNPLKTIELSLNYESVVYNYLQGFPT